MKTLLAIISIFLVVAISNAETYTAASTSFVDVSNAIALSASGDTVTVPTGTAAWTNTLFVTKNIQLIGAGIGQTVITNTVGSGNGVMIQWTTGTNGGIRLSGLTLTAPQNTAYAAGGCLTLLGHCDAVRIDHIRWQNIMSGAAFITEANFGVIDHCQIANTNSGAPGVGFNMLNGATGAGQSSATYGGWGDYSYSTNFPMVYGTTNFFMYVEDCVFDCNGEGRSTGQQVSDGKSGSRFCYRYNLMTNADLETHGTDGPERGARAYEFYNNVLVHTGTYTNSGSAFYLASGSGVIFSNTFVGWGIGAGLNGFVNYRSVFGADIATIWGGANGLNPLDLNTNGLIASGFHTGTNHSYFLEDTNSGWSNGQFANNSYEVINTTVAGGTNTASFSLVITNTTTKLYHKPNPFAFNPAYQLWWTNGQPYAIRQTGRVFDQPGSGNGDLILRDGSGNAYNTNTGTLSWPRQTIDPIYIWGNTLNGNPVSALVNYGFIDTGTTADGNYNNIKLGIDYLNTTKPGYIPLVYPHPLAQTNSPAPPATGNVTTVGRIYF